MHDGDEKGRSSQGGLEVKSHRKNLWVGRTVKMPMTLYEVLV